MNGIPQSALPPLLDWPRDEAAHTGLPWEIWWVSAALDAAGRRLGANALFIHFPDGRLRVSATLTELEGDRERTGVLLAPPGGGAVAMDRLALSTPLCSFTGAYADGYALRADLGGGAGFDLALRPTRPVLHNGGAAQFPFQGVATTQYSVGFLEVSGHVRLDGEDLPATGRGWHDRQWDHGPRAQPATFSWFGLCLESGDALSVFDTRSRFDEGQRWATIAEPDGTHIVTAAEWAGDGSHRAASGRTMPQRWTVTIPARQAELELSHQRIADQPAIYTGLVQIGGTYAGAPARGYGFCDIVGPIDPA